MKFCDLSYELLSPKDYSLEEGKKFIERVARTCYKSENLIKEGSADKFYNMLVENKHIAMLEHYTVYLKCTWYCGHDNPEGKMIDFFIDNPYSRVVLIHKDYEKKEHFHPVDAYITTNLRVIYENNRWADLDAFICHKPEKYHILRYSVKFIINVGAGRDINRHRVDSIAESSTRYCNFSKDKFGNELTVIKPSWYSDYSDKDIQGLSWYCHCIANDNTDSFQDFDYWLFAMLASEYSYMNLIKNGRVPDEARGVLPLDIKTEIVHTAFIDDWQHFFDLRTSILAKTGKPHPQVSELADQLYKEFIEKGYFAHLQEINNKVEEYKQWVENHKE